MYHWEVIITMFLRYHKPDEATKAGHFVFYGSAFAYSVFDIQKVF